jgi:glutamyl-tRNA reductase
MKKVWNRYCEGDQKTLESHSYQKDGIDAIRHLYRVSVGLDSQILGDHEIIGQVRKSYKFAKSIGALDSFTERLFQRIFKTAKQIRSETSICEGAASTAFAAIHYLRTRLGKLRDKKILVFGAGKIGSNTTENLLNFVKASNITLINRDPNKSKVIADRHGIQSKKHEDLYSQIPLHDAVIVATNAASSTVSANMLKDLSNPVIFVDLSVPRNVDPAIADLKGASVIHIDDLSKLQEEAIDKRRSSIPVAEMLIDESIIEFAEWTENRKLSPAFKAIKTCLGHLHKQEVSPYLNGLADSEKQVVEETTSKIVNRIARNLINHIKENNNQKQTPVELVEAILNLELDENVSNTTGDSVQ